MLRNLINIVGIDDPSSFPVLGVQDRYKQFTVEEMLTIPSAKPDIEQITSVLVEANVTQFRTIATPTGVKVIVDGELHQKVIYTADEPAQSVHSAEFTTPFCNFIEIPLVIASGKNIIQILQGLGLTLDDVVTKGPSIIIEDLSVTQVGKRNVKKCAVLFTWVTVNTALTPLFPPAA